VRKSVLQLEGRVGGEPGTEKLPEYNETQSKNMTRLFKKLLFAGQKSAVGPRGGQQWGIFESTGVSGRRAGKIALNRERRQSKAFTYPTLRVGVGGGVFKSVSSM